MTMNVPTRSARIIGILGVIAGIYGIYLSQWAADESFGRKLSTILISLSVLIVLVARKMTKKASFVEPNLSDHEERRFVERLKVVSKIGVYMIASAMLGYLVEVVVAIPEFSRKVILVTIFSIFILGCILEGSCTMIYNKRYLVKDVG